MATNPANWRAAEAVELTLPSQNTIAVRPVDMAGLVLSSENGAIPNQLLQQISDSFSGATPDRELICHSGTRLPSRGEPVLQGDVRGRVVDAEGTDEMFVVRVAMLAGTKFEAGTIRFGGINNATVQSESAAKWKPKLEDLPQMGEFINLICRTASVSPKLVKEVTDPETELLVTRLSQADRMFIFNWAMPSEVHPAATFPAR